MKSITPRIFGALVAFAVVIWSCGCNTMKGIGEDTEEAGEELQEAAEDASD